MIEFCVIVEDEADAQIACCLAERVLVDKLEWLYPSHLQHMFKWSGFQENTNYSRWQDIGDIIEQFKQRGFRVPKYLGHGKDGRLKADGAATMKILNLIGLLQHKMQRQIAVVLFIRDLDNQPERRAGMEQVRKEHAALQPVLRINIGTANRMREAWVLNGLIPSIPEEKRLLNEIKEKLSFDSCEEAHRLRSTSGLEPDRLRNPKVVVELLTGGDKLRERQCWEETSLDKLHSIGTQTGLADYLTEIEQRLIPLPCTI